MARTRPRVAVAIAVTILVVLLSAFSACTSHRNTGVSPFFPVPTTTPPKTSEPPAPTPAPTVAPRPKPRATPKPIIPVKGPPAIYNSKGALKTTGSAGVALTFDDGPDPYYTPKMLDLLRAQRVKATFCLIGFRAQRYPAIVRRIAAEGHTLCNHSYQHLMDLGVRDTAFMVAELKNTNAAIRSAVPTAKIKYFRAPGGSFTPQLVSVAKSLGMRSLHWTVDTRDWDYATYGRGSTMVNHIIYAIQHITRAGSIILAHDLGKPDTLTAMKTAIPWLKSHFRLIPLPV